MFLNKYIQFSIEYFLSKNNPPATFDSGWGLVKNEHLLGCVIDPESIRVHDRLWKHPTLDYFHKSVLNLITIAIRNKGDTLGTYGDNQFIYMPEHAILICLYLLEEIDLTILSA